MIDRYTCLELLAFLSPFAYLSIYLSLSSGTPGLAVLQQQGELRDLLQEAGAFS